MTAPQKKKLLGDRELIVMMASIMALNALAIDAMLPAFPRMAAGLGVIDANRIQYVITPISWAWARDRWCTGPCPTGSDGGRSC
jgi:DHA1 family bicyclomycin/chloramphenicol resistance-like MFS transporter